ncbi:MAG: c-type cytochrome [Gemmatimonadetes bacterium]|nr:c-type cytochrome [Gemmatimonadota bacterium]
MRREVWIPAFAGMTNGYVNRFMVLAFMVLLATPLPASPAAVAQGEPEPPGKATYDRWCAGCHGETGQGDGFAAPWMLPRPRDFTQALYQIRTTASGGLPTDADILRIIDEGMPGTAMPGWRDRLSSAERAALVEYVKSFSRFFEGAAPPETLEFGRAPRATAERLADGRAIYDSIECWRCHGQQGRADGTSSPTLRDDADLPIRAADLTMNWRFNGGGRVEDIYRRMRTGLDGTPMPSQSDLLTAGVVTDDELWSLALYVRSLSPEEPPPVREVFTAALAEGELPTSPGDSIWAEVERFFVPLVGQIIVRPRWFAPTVNGVWVQALHNHQELALRLAWSDPSRSPDPAWDEWQAAVLQTMEPREGDSIQVAPRPDALTVQFPRRVPTGMERPYFLMGTAQEPVYLWSWRSDQEGAVEALGRGLGSTEPLGPSESPVTASAEFADGEWSVLFRRSLAAADSANRIPFPIGEAVPVAFFAWDGSNTEEGRRGAISTWYFLYLEPATPPTVFVAPLVALLLTAGFGVLMVSRAQRRERQP